jgi:hypothetical protein
VKLNFFVRFLKHVYPPDVVHSRVWRLNGSAASHKIDHCNYQGNHQQQVNQAACHMKAPAQKPENDENCKNRPKHFLSTPQKIKSRRQTTKGERQLFKAELSLDYGFH